MRAVGKNINKIIVFNNKNGKGYMCRLTITVLAIIILIGCESAADREETAVDRVKVAAAETKEMEIQSQNSERENFVLLGIKYSIPEEKVIIILDDYEYLTTGGSWRSREQWNPNISDVPTAIDNLSKKYQIDKKTLVAILMDKKMLEKCTQD